MTLPHIAFLFFGTALASFVFTGLALRLLRRQGIVDTPNERSSHEIPTPRGGGIAVTSVLLVCWSLVLSDALPAYQWLLIGSIFIAVVSWLDDIKGLSPFFRLGAQFVAVIGVFWLMPSTSLYFHGLLPLWLDNLIAMFLWVWFLNLFNFMDGIDGISGIEASSIGIGVFLVTLIGMAQLSLGLLGLCIAASVIGFLWWNWQPAKIFLGDVGSVPLGFLLGWLLLEILASPAWPAAVILPLYYLADATTTLVKRAINKEKVWQAHRQHFYQRATQRGLSHARVSLMVLATNVLLIALALFSVTQPVPALLASLVVVIAFLFILRGPSGGESS